MVETKGKISLHTNSSTSRSGATALATDGKLADASIDRVVIHPLVLLSAVDHYRRKGFG